MSNIGKFIRQIDDSGIRLWSEEGRLKYRAPKGVMTNEIRSRLAERRDEILTFLNKADTISGENYTSIQPVDRTEPGELSFAQKRLWILDRMGEENKAVYNIPMFYSISGPVDISLVNRVLNEIIRRHEILRTIFMISGDDPVQIILPKLKIDLPITDIGELPETEKERKAKQIASKALLKSFDLSEGPLIRSHILHMGSEKHVLLITVHHIVFDGRSASVFFREFKKLYEAFLEDNPFPLPDPEIQYADFAAWQRKMLNGEALKGHLNYWKNRLSGAPAILELPADRPRPPVQSFNGDFIRFEIDADLTAHIKDLTRKTGATLFMVLYAVFVTLLSRYSGQEDIVIGSPIANRNHKQTEHLIGFFVNMLSLRADLSGDPSFASLLEQVKSTTLNAYEHQDLPFEKLVDELNIERSMSHAPLFQVIFALQNVSAESPDVAGLKFLPFEFDYNMAKFDLAFSIEEKGGKLEGAIEYNTDLFDEKTIERMSGHFEVLLMDITSNPEKKVSELLILTDIERQRLLVEFNDTKSNYPKDKCFHQLFEDQVKKTPDATAVVFLDKQLTYRELNERANQLAHYLIALGVGPEKLVGLSMEHSLELIVGIMGILKAGGAYVPLDPAYPEDRLAFMLSDSGASLIVTQQKHAAVLKSSSATLVCMDTAAFDGRPALNPDVPMAPDNLAYVIYTSGSTGNPKGVMIEHRGLCNTSEAQVRAFGLGSKDRHLLFFSPSFDGCTADIILALRVGAALYMAPRHEILPGEPLRCFLQKHEITTLILTPSALAQVPSGDLPALHTVIVAGELCSADLVSRWNKNRKFLNLYGATEASIFSTVSICKDGVNPPPVGRPVVNNRIYILDDHLQPVPVGIPGEIHIGGVGIARGYLNRPELNRTRFIPDPFEPGRLYKTGDLGRYTGDGNIDFIGRIDNQVKIRGFRIELDEIECVLGMHPDVQEAVVAARTEENGQQRLVAYVVAKEIKNPAILRDDLRRKLPDYMIPSGFVLMDTLPLTPNGKADRKALPEPMSYTETDYVAPRNEIERQIAITWQQTIQENKVGIHDNFFEIGGNSLLILQVHSRLEKIYGKEIAVTDLFKYPTVSTLATRLSDIIEYRSRKDSVKEREKIESWCLIKGQGQRKLRQKSRKKDSLSS